MNETVKEKMPASKGKTIALSIVCVLLLFVLTTLLLTCLTAKRFVHDAPIREAFSKIELNEVTFSDGTSLAAKINRDYIGEGVIKDDQLSRILQSKAYSTWVGEKAEDYTRYIAAGTGSGEIFPEILTPQIDALVRSTEDDIRLQTGIHDFMNNNPQFLRNLKPDLENWNHRMRDTISTGFTAKLISAAVSRWMPYVSGALLLLGCIWMLVIQTKGQNRIGTAFKICAVTGFVPSAILLLWGLFGTLLLRAVGMGYLQETAKALRSIPLMFGGLACLACAALFILGMLFNSAAELWASRPKRERPSVNPVTPEMPAPPQPAPNPLPAAPVAAPAPAVKKTEESAAPAVHSTPTVSLAKPSAPAAEEPPVTRKFCRFCGQELINSNAMFCYRCGKAQE